MIRKAFVHMRMPETGVRNDWKTGNHYYKGVHA